MKPIARIKPGGEDKRVLPRADIRIPLTLKLPSVDAVVSGEAVNISKSGMFIAMQELPPLGTQFDVTIEGADRTLPMHANVEVVRHAQDPVRGVGARFLDVSYEAQALIDRMLSDQRAFGDYRLDVLVGRGGMAEVYRATALAGPHAGKTVALKRILPELAKNPVVVDLFRKEAALTSTLEHPQIVEVYEVGSVGDALYIAMEYVEGCDLREILEECANRRIFLPLDFCCYVVQTVARALDFAHKARGADGKLLNIVHRDVSPANVFISQGGVIKLGDFGVAHIGEQDKNARNFTIAGKHHYVSPEQILAGHLSPATDVFAACCMLYELLTNELAFHGLHRDQVWKRITAGEVAAPRSLRPEISEELQELVLTGLSPRIAGSPVSWRAQFRELRGGKKRERFPDAASLMHALDGVYDHAIGNDLAIASVVRGLFPERLRKKG